MTFAMYDRLGEIAREANADDSLRCLVLTGAGDKAFVAGTDIGQFREFRTEQDAVEYEERMERKIGSAPQVRIPTIAAVRGACTGGGFAIAGRLRHPRRLAERAVRDPDRPHPRQLPLDGLAQPADRPDGAGAGEGDALHRPPHRSGRRRVRSAS